jgi:plasmid stabilization system protein ParE
VAEIVTSRRAEEELRQIWRYIAAENPTAAAMSAHTRKMMA